MKWQPPSPLTGLRSSSQLASPTGQRPNRPPPLPISPIPETLTQSHHVHPHFPTSFDPLPPSGSGRAPSPNARRVPPTLIAGAASLPDRPSSTSSSPTPLSLAPSARSRSRSGGGRPDIAGALDTTRRSASLEPPRRRASSPDAVRSYSTSATSPDRLPVSINVVVPVYLPGPRCP
nr:WAS/WASL-interacting protein family member 1-like [Aegilops tauschii subsp. strangulata]